MKYSELFDPTELQSAVLDGYVTTRPHLRLPLVILNYTPKAQYDNHWTPVTRACRGLIIDHTGEVVSRPFEKFFNFDDEKHAAVIPMDAPVDVLDKIDGSLGIAYPDPIQPTGWAVATRGSFHSVQAAHATARYQESHASFKPRQGWTYLYEIVYPENRIVVDYGQDDNLYLIGVINNSTGKMLPLKHGTISVPRTTISHFPSYETFLKGWKPRPGIEGVVVQDTTTGAMVKVKTEEYITLHRITFSLSAKAVWEALRSDRMMDYVSLPTPYLQQWAVETAEAILDHREAIAEAVGESWMQLRMKFGEKPTDASLQREHRKVVAQWVSSEKKEHAKYLWLMYDGRSKALDEAVWKAIEPVGDIRPTLTQSVEG